MLVVLAKSALTIVTPFFVLVLVLPGESSSPFEQLIRLAAKSKVDAKSKPILLVFFIKDLL